MFEDVDGPEQTTLIRALIVVGIGLPIIIEVATFGGILSHHITGSPSDGAAPAPTETPTETFDGAAVGDEILRETSLTATITRGSVVTTDEGWQFLLTINATNADAVPRELTVGTVTTRSGSEVEGAGTTGTIEPGDSATVTGSWLLPKGQRPDSVTVTVVTSPKKETETDETYTVSLGAIPVSNE